MQIMAPNHAKWGSFVQTLQTQKRCCNDKTEDEIRRAILRCFGFDEESVETSLEYLREYHPVLTDKMLKDLER